MANLRMASNLSRFRVQLFMRRLQGRGDIGQKGRKRARHGGAARDQNIVMTAAPQKGQQLRRSGAQPALGTVAGDRIADFLAGGEPHAQPPLKGFGLGCGAGFQGNGAFYAADSPRGSQKIGALFQMVHDKGDRRVQAESFLRPLLRRRFSTLRPPAVAMRERKP